MMHDPRYISGSLVIALLCGLTTLAIFFWRRSREAGREVARRELLMPAALFVMIFGSIPLLEAALGPLWNSRQGAMAMAVVTLVFAVSGARGMMRRRQAAGLLLQVGNPPPPWKFLAPLIGVGGLLLLVLLWKVEFGFHFWWMMMITSSTSVGLLSARGGLQVRERGMLFGFQMVPWKDITAFALDDVHDTLTLSLSRASFQNPFAKITFNVPPVDQADVVALLSSRVHPSEGEALLASGVPRRTEPR